MLPWFKLQGSTVLTVMSGAPFNVVTGMDDRLDGFLNDRPTGLDRNTGESTSLDAINAERQRLNDEFGWDVDHGRYLAPVSSLREPTWAQLDLRVWKPFGYGGGDKQGQVFLQIINVFDRENGGFVDGRLVSQTFGQVIGQAAPGRTFETGVRFGF